MANEDRVRDVYLRRIDTVATQDACRDRVHWLCEQVEGQRIVDIGCSQGITAVILAREGHEVVGVDIEPEGLAVAAEALTHEPPLVQQRVRFVLGDAFVEDFPAAGFETAVLGEILEHLTTPEQLLERVGRWLVPGGRVVVSVPHGYHPYHDHKRSYYLASLVELLNQWFTVAKIEVVAGRFLGAVALKPAGDGLPGPPTVQQLLAWSRHCQVALERNERQVYSDRLTRQAEYRELEERAARLREAEASTRKALDELRVTVAVQKPATEQRLRQHEQARKILRRRLAATREDLHKQREENLLRAQEARTVAARLQEQLQAAQRRVQSAEKTGQERNAQIAKLRGELARTQALQKSREEQRVQKLRGQVDVYKGELAVMRQSVRYRLGDAFVRACIPSWDTLQLPFRVVALLRDGLRQRRARRDAEQSQPRPALPVSTATARPREDSAPMVSAAPQPPPAAIAGADLDRIPTLAEPFSSPPPELRRRSDLVLAAVTDEFSWEAWRYEAECYTFTPTTWRAALEARRPDLLLVESAWSGVGNSWYFQVRDLGQRGDVIKYYALPEIVAWCRAQGVPTVFYNKEDPPHFDVFLEAARQFDYVFTSDANCIEAYRRHLGHERVFSLPFAAQPRIHNPIMTGTRSGAVCFAGTWYANRHFDRQSDAEIILRPALDFDLHIFDRRAASGDPNFRWPDEFLPALRGSLPYAQMLAAYKRYRVFLNLNSVADSPTMFARRVFELLACGTPVISASSPGIAALLGADTVLLSDSAAQTRAHLERVLGDDSFREQLALRGQRKVFGAHTYTHRLQTILDTIGLPRDPMAAPALTMVAAVADPAEAASAWANYDRQAYPHKRLVMCATRADAVAHVPSLAGADANVSVLVIEGAQWGQVLGAAMAEAPGYVCALHPAHHYGPHYLTDYAHATLYVTEPALGKATHYEAQNGTLRVVKSGQEYRVVSGVNPWTLCLTRAHAQACAVQLAHAQTPEEWWNRSMRSLERLYSADRFNYVRRTEQPTGGDDANAAHAPALEPAVV